MFSLRDLVVFLAGVEFFHTVVHILLPHFIAFPIEMKHMAFTTSMNLWAIAINAVLTIALLWLAAKMKKSQKNVE